MSAPASRDIDRAERAKRRSAIVFAAAVFLFALAVRLYFVTRAVVSPPDQGDAGQYLAYAWNLVRHGTFSVAVGDMPIIPDAWRAPGYPAFMAAFLAVWGEDAYRPILLAQAALGAVTIALAAAMARRAAGLGIGLAVAFVGSVWPHLVASTAYLLAEALYGACMVAAAAGLSRAIRTASLRWSVVSGVTAGLAWLTNPVCAAAWLLVALLVAFRGDRRVAVAFVLAFAVAPFGWSLRNAVTVPAQAAGSGDRAWVNFVQGSRPEYHIVHRQRLAHAMTPAAVEAWSEMEREIAIGTRSKREGLRAVATRLGRTPLDSLQWYLGYKPADLWGWDIAVGQGSFYVFPTYRSPYEQVPLFRAIAAVCLGLNPLLALAALAAVGATAVGLRSRRAIEAIGAERLITVGVLVAVTGVHVLLQAEPRYSVPYRMFEFIAAGIAIQAAVQWMQARRASRPGVPNDA